MDYESIAKKILQRVGGKENVISLVHCMTRLRFTLKDESIVDDEAVKKTKGVMGIMKKAGQYQIIIGNDVANVYAELNKLGNFSNEVPKKAPQNKEKQNVFSMLMDTISGIMAPVIPAIIGAAMIKVLLTLLPMIGVLSTKGDTYNLLSVMGDGAFFFMPVLIAISASKKFGTNMYYAASIALIMLHPNFISFMNSANDAKETVKFLKFIPVTYASYAYSVIPIILAVWSLKYVERLVDKITPVVTKNFLKPMLVVLIEAPIALIILGPLGAICGNVLSTVVYTIHDKLGFIAIGLVAGVYPFVVMAGMHHAFTPIKLGMIASTGFENFICIGELCSNMAQGAASLAVAVKSKNKDFKQIAGSSAFSALFAGITEPALYGVTLRLKRPMLGACIGAAAGGLFGGFFQMKCFGIATPAIVTIVQYVEKGKPQSLLFAALTILLTIVVAFIATMIIGFEDVVDENDDELDMLETESKEEVKVMENAIDIASPAEGKAISLSEVADATFAQEILGKGAAIVPEKGVIYAPFDGKVDVMFETGHAVGLVGENGVELLVHIGIDTVNLEGKYFSPKKAAGDVVKKGDVLIEFDIEKIKEVEKIIIQYDGLAKLKDAKVVSGEQRINREDLSDEFKNVVSLEATNNTKRNILFSSGVFTIKEGKNIGENDKDSIIVHEEFAKQNNLKLGDEVDLELLDIEKSGKIKSHKFKIIGIFSGKKHETYTGLSSDFTENMVFVDYSTSQEILNKSENNKIANKILMYSGSAESTDLALNKLKELKIDESKYFVEKDSNAFEESLESVSGIKHIIKIMTYSIMLGGMVVLSLILILWLRERIYEIGIFLSIGTSKIHIIMQFIFELLFISIPSIISSLFLGNVLLKVIAGGIVNSEDSMISGGSLINDSFMLNITTLGQSYLILISIIVLSVVFASSLILIKKPKEILSKIS